MQNNTPHSGKEISQLPDAELDAIINRGGPGLEKLLDDVLEAPPEEEPERWDGQS